MSDIESGKNPVRTNFQIKKGFTPFGESPTIIKNVQYENLDGNAQNDMRI